jgi:hypothetical protein
VSKKIAQFLILFTTILLIIFFFKFYLTIEDKNSIEKKTNKNNQDVNDQVIDSDNSIIKGLKYEINLNKNNKYSITSNFNKIKYINNEEVVDMKEVTAVYVDKNNLPITITSDEAIYNNSTFNTIFKKNVKIDYQSNIITSNIINLDFKRDEINISENVKYFNEYGLMIADEIKIDLISKELFVYMKDAGKKVKFISK